MASIYLAFLHSGSAASLADDAVLHYITTTTNIHDAPAIAKHLAAQAKQVVKKEEKVLNTIVGANGVCLETATTLQFRMGGGAYLPGMDANMLDERIVTFPLTHVVTFNAAQKIQQVRLYWDQGTLLRQVEAIGKTGRNWPIRDGPAQTQAVVNSIKSGGESSQTSTQADSGNARTQGDVTIREHAKRDSVSVTRDPHASLTLFAERDPNEDSNRSYTGPKHAIRSSAKPTPRDYNELFANEESPSVMPGAKVRSPSPHKTNGTILKAGAGKHFGGNRLFDDQDEQDMPKSPERKKTFGGKYEHFTFGDGEDAPAPKENRPVSGKNVGQQTFSFDDFATPPKHTEKRRPDDVRHWGAGVDADDPGSPPKRPIVHAARPDAESHFKLTDAASPAASKTAFQRGKGMGLYQDPTNSDSLASAKKTNPSVNNTRRGDEFDNHVSLQDNSPANAVKPKATTAPRSDMDSHWGYESPKEKKIYKTAGDGMGSRKGRRAWGIGDESDPEIDQPPVVRSTGRGRRAQAEAQAGAEMGF